MILCLFTFIKSIKLLLITLFLTLSGCATIFTGTSDEITFTSKPDGAEIYIDHNKIGSTPLSIAIDRELYDSEITFKLFDCKNTNLKLIRVFNKWSIANLTIWPGWAIDALTGAILKAQFNTYHADINCL